MGLLDKIFSSSTRDLAVPQSGPELPPAGDLVSFPLPPGQYGQDMPRWHSLMKPAAALLSEIAQMEALQALKKGEKYITFGPALPVRPSTLLDNSPESGVLLSGRLHANLVESGIVVMATPTESESKLWRHSMDEHHVTHVVRLGTDVETVLLNLIPRTATPFPKGRQLAGSTPDARHWYVTLEPNYLIPPSMMLKVFRELSENPPAPGCQVAFQSPSGDDRSAVFAAGWRIYQEVSQRCKAGKRMDNAALEDVVQAAVLKVKTHRSTQLLNEPVHVSALLALAQTVRDTVQRRGTRHPAEIQERALASASVPRSSAKGASETHHERVARDICNKLKEIRWATEPKFAPLKGSTGQRRVHIGGMFPPDPQLKGLGGARLLGAWATPTTLVLEPTGPAHALALAVACLKHNFAAVVDVGSKPEPAAAHAMDNGTRTFDDDSSATFQWQGRSDVPLQDALGATTTRMEVSAQVRGTPVMRDVSLEPVFVQSEDIQPTQRPMELIRAPLSAGQAVPAEELMAIGQLMEWFHTDGTNTPVIVQCPAGDWRGVMAAAADKLYSRFQEGALQADNREDVVEGIWSDLCTHYSMDLADEPEQLASLLRMADLLVAKGTKTGRW